MTDRLTTLIEELIKSSPNSEKRKLLNVLIEIQKRLDELDKTLARKQDI